MKDINNLFYDYTRRLEISKSAFFNELLGYWELFQSENPGLFARIDHILRKYIDTVKDGDDNYIRKNWAKDMLNSSGKKMEKYTGDNDQELINEFGYTIEDIINISRDFSRFVISRAPMTGGLDASVWFNFIYFNLVDRVFIDYTDLREKIMTLKTKMSKFKIIMAPFNMYKEYGVEGLIYNDEGNLFKGIFLKSNTEEDVDGKREVFELIFSCPSMVI